MSDLDRLKRSVRRVIQSDEHDVAEWERSPNYYQNEITENFKERIAWRRR